MMTLKSVSALFVLALVSSAQTQQASLRGVVQDSTGATIPSASLTLTNIDQNRSWETKANDSGSYVFLQIPPGNYSLTVEAPGFKKYNRTGLTLEVAMIAEINVPMEVGSVSESVQVTGETPLLETANSTLGEVVNAMTTENLPLNGRNVLQLVALTPGINVNSNYRNQTSGSGSIGSNGFSANGGRNVSSSILVDGSPQEVMGYNQPAYVPSPDAVQEFKVQTNNLSAEYGRTGGAVINMVHRSGTSKFSGVLYEFLRNDKFDANGFFNNLNGRSKGAFRFNQFGGTVGGPLSKSRQRSFFFVNYEGVRVVNPGSATFTVPTEQMRGGNFSEIAGVIYDPATINAAGERQPFAGNIIPASQQNAVGRKLVSYYPLPTRAGVINNFFTQRGSRNQRTVLSTRIDHRFSDNHNIFGRYSYDYATNTQADQYSTAASPNPGWDGVNNNSATIDDTLLWKGWVIHGNLGYAYHSNPRGPFEGRAPKPSELGFPSYVDAVAQFYLFPTINVSGYAQLGPESSYIIGNKFETYTATGDASRLFGSHTIKFGGTHRLNRVSNFRPNNPSGTYTFNDGFTRRVFNQTGGGDAIASMLLGLASSGAIQTEPALALQVKYSALYFQDDWRVNDRLTLNFGLRWDVDHAQTERFDRASWFDPNVPIPLTVPGMGAFHGGIVFAGERTPGAPRGVRDFDGNNFAPRLGLAYRLSRNLVFRSGVGFFYAPTTGIGPNATTAGGISFNSNTPYTSSIDGGRTPYTTISNPFPDGFIPPRNGADGLLTFVGQGITANFRQNRVPYSAQWNGNLQYELPRNILLDVAYAGNSGVKLQANAALNQLPDEYLALGNDLNRVVANPFFGVLPAASSIGRATTTYGQLLLPRPWLTGLTQSWGTLAHSSYHALQAKFRKRYSNGLQFLVAYTWSKTIDDFSSVAGFLGEQNPGFTNNNRRDLDKSISALHMPHNLVINYQWELPFGKGRRWMTQGGALDYLFGGWILNGVSSFQSGTPISIGSRNNTSNSYAGGQRPVSTMISSKTSGSTKERIYGWFNPAAFVDAAPFTFGNVGRFLPDNLGPPLQNWDLSILKDLRLSERMKLQFRAELFNAFNNVNFSNPAGTTFGQPNFGQITGAERARIIQFGLKLYY
jgi:hypothetical protein